MRIDIDSVLFSEKRFAMVAQPQQISSADDVAHLEHLACKIRDAIVFIDSQFAFDEGISIASNHLQNALDIIVDQKERAS